jgi:hypothetical protein
MMAMMRPRLADGASRWMTAEVLMNMLDEAAPSNIAAGISKPVFGASA